MTEAGEIQRLRRPTATRLRSALVIPTLAQVVNELAQNALDAGASSVECWVSLVPGEESVRVVDDGGGIGAENLGAVARRYCSSKGGAWSGAESYGFRGEALASLAALSLLEITSRVAGEDTYSKIIKNGEVLYCGAARRDLGRAHGTAVVVRDLFNGIPVRQAALASGPGNTLLACRRALEALVLVNPRVRWTLHDAIAGKKVVAWHGGRRSLDAFRALYGHAAAERAQNIRVSSGVWRADGFISLDGAVTKAHQHLYINGYPLAASELHLEIARRFAASSFATTATDLTDDIPDARKRPSPRRLERHPVYVLNITVPADQVDAAYHPNKATLSYGEPSRVRGFVGAIVDDFLHRHGFGPAKRASPPPSPSKKDSRQSQATQRLGAANALPAPSHPVRRRLPLAVPSPGRALPLWPSSNRDELGDEPRRLFTKKRRATSPPANESDKAEAAHTTTTNDTNADEPEAFGLGTSTVETTTRTKPSSAEPDIATLQKHARRQVFSSRPCDAACVHHSVSTSLEETRPAPADVFGDETLDVTFTREQLASATVLRQVDRKFVPCVLETADRWGAPQRTLVVLDQHAADERAAVEGILDALCEGFVRNDMPVTELEEGRVAVVLTREEARALDVPGVREALRRWGIGLNLPSSLDMDYVQVRVSCVPSALERLARPDAAELTRLLRLYLPFIADHVGELRAFLASLDHTSDVGASVRRWMPREMVELANSKACRGAIMFEDRLDHDQCSRLVARLAATRNPWICAHGRPTSAPLRTFGDAPVRARRTIDWAAWGQWTSKQTFKPGLELQTKQ